MSLCIFHGKGIYPETHFHLETMPLTSKCALIQNVDAAWSNFIATFKVFIFGFNLNLENEMKELSI